MENTNKPISSKSSKVGEKWINEVTVWNATSKSNGEPYHSIVFDSSYLITRIKEAKDKNNGVVPEKLYFASFFPKDKMTTEKDTLGSEFTDVSIKTSDLPF